ncbi:MAG: DNA translocase FtsK [Candidatus Andersenbacteria bacterium CG10_big_fil_rev_8_21_14_0_10_54_11]|uniref:DNA translocase FtsK n=1 Tax=Candidatus Andersenbacteria bacterium CG10_big_fil_rev_8_21_14_0_10_54_11 TaxID=1974485 RepID=A0A2M6WZG3_9BACT|nr:MAG: DNA translocase FtsK [Candidatus Andersenbacteria bacterium CG10_big_fil_rev_8_21_14_0_10_54_11]
MRLNPFSRTPRRGRSRRSSAARDPWLSAFAKKAIAGIFLIIFSLIALLSFFNAAGPLGAAIRGLLEHTFGWLAYPSPAALLAWGGYLLWPQRLRLPALQVVGLLLAGVGLLGFLHTVAAHPDDALQLAHDGAGGGYAGFVLSYPLSQVLSRFAAGLIFAGALGMGVILTFRRSPADLWEWLTVRLAARRGLRADEEGAELADLPDSETERLPHFAVGALPGSKAAASPAAVAASPAAAPVRASISPKRYQAQILQALHRSGGEGSSRDKDYEQHMKALIRQTLEEFNISVEMAETNVGPTVTQYTLRPEVGIRLSQITALQNDLARALKAHPVRIEAPIPNTDLVGIEVPNRKVALVRLRELLVSKSFRQAQGPLAFPLGKDVSGQTVVDTLDRMPHLLIAGATGSGKSVNIHSLLLSLLFRNTADTLRLILVDPKRVELPPYNGIPHLLTPVIVDSDKTLHALKWALGEMDRRYRLLEESGARNLLSFNARHPDEARPFIVIVLDELADLMVKHAREIEGPIVRLTQMARAVGIHLVLATQRPSVNVITGLIKANVPARIAFSVASQVDSRTILDMAGAEKLVGNGDMLYMAGDKARPIRIQGGFVSEEEVRRAVALIQQTGEPEYDESIVSPLGGSAGGSDGPGDDPLFEEAKQLVIASGKASTSFLQRRLRLGYSRAARIMDMLEEHGVISMAEGNKPRHVLAEAPTGSTDAGVDTVDEFDTFDSAPPAEEADTPW